MSDSFVRTVDAPLLPPPANLVGFWATLRQMFFTSTGGAILGFVGEGGIGHDLKLAMQWGQGRYDEVVAIFLLLFVAIVLIDRISDYYRHKLVTGL